MDLDWPPHPAHSEPTIAPTTTSVELVRSGGPPDAAAPPVSVPSLSEEELAAPVAILDEDIRQRVCGASFRERLAATAQLEPWHASSNDEFCTVLRACAVLGRHWANENNVQVASTGLRFLHVQLRVFLDYRCAEASSTRTHDPLHYWAPTIPLEAEGCRALASICGTAAARLSDRKSSSIARDILHAATELYSLRWVLAAAIEPLAAAAITSPAPAAAALSWLSAALELWQSAAAKLSQRPATVFDDLYVPQAAIACCAAALRSPAGNTRGAALSALAALDRHCPVLEAIAAPENGFSQSVVSTVRAELGKQPPSRVVFRRTPRDCMGRVKSGQSAPEEALSPNPAALGLSGQAQTEIPLEFSSDFECGNLAFAAMVDRREYELWLDGDTNVPNHRVHTQWFFFRVRHMVQGQPYRFTIMNFEKPSSLFSKGMQPVVYSEKAAALPGGCGWHRSGSDIRYKPGRPRPKPTVSPSTKRNARASVLDDGSDEETSEPEDASSECGQAEEGLGIGRYKLLRKRLLRARASLTSMKQGSLASQTVVDVTEVTRLENTPSGKGALRGKCVDGWFTMEAELMEPVPIDTNTIDESGASEPTFVGDGPLLPKPSSAMNFGPVTSETDVLQQKQRQQQLKANKRRKKNVRTKGDSWADVDCFYQLEMTLVSEHADDTLYVAMAVPYSYSKLQQRLEVIEQSPHVHRRQLCTTRGGRRCDVLTVTQSPRPTSSELMKRQNVVLSARVHPGETNASWLMDGVLDLLIDETNELAQKLRQHFIFTIIPMLNPDGVAVGNYRCSLSGRDLNRTWDSPSPVDHPEIHAAKALVMRLHRVRPAILRCPG